MSYRDELRAHVTELQEQARAVDFANDPNASEKHEHLRRLAEIIDFILTHPDDALANLKRND